MFKCVLRIDFGHKILSVFLVVHPKTAMRNELFVCKCINRKQQCTISLSIGQEDIHTQTLIFFHK